MDNYNDGESGTGIGGVGDFGEESGVGVAFNEGGHVSEIIG